MVTEDKIVVISGNEKFSNPWIDTLKKKRPDITVEVYPEDTNRKNTKFIMAFQPPEGVFQKYPNLEVIASLTAGVKHILKDPDLPKDVAITKVNDPLHKKDMAIYALTAVLSYLRDFEQYRQDKAKKQWSPNYAYKRPEDINVGLMGFGAIGQEISKLLLQNGFKVSGWSRSKKKADGVETFYGEDQKTDFLKTAQVLICILPLTDQTKGILNLEVFKALPKDAYLINMARGAHLVDKDLETALAEGILSGATLDVFNQEPLPKHHPFWTNEKVMITPHVAGVTDPNSILNTLLKNFEAMKKGKDLVDVVDASEGY